MKINLNSKEKEIFNYINDLIGKEYLLYLVGGSVRDIILNKPTFDLDFTTSCPADKVNTLIKDAIYFAKFGTNTFKIDNYHITIATLRKEEGYDDYRHPNKIVFVNSIEDEYLRRDFTINCLYVDSSLRVIDPTKKGLEDINNKIIRIIGDKEKRIIEDPLRIIRAYRFKYLLNFEIEDESKKAINSHLDLLTKLNKQKINEELNKVKDYKNEIIKQLNLDFIYNK